MSRKRKEIYKCLIKLSKFLLHEQSRKNIFNSIFKFNNLEKMRWMRWDGGEVKDNNAVYVLPHGTMKFSNLFNINISYDEVL